MRLLVDVVRQEFGVEHDEIVLFRHTKKDSDIVLKYCEDLDDWTACQPIGAKYDYRMDGKTKSLVAIVVHCIYRVFRLGDT